MVSCDLWLVAIPYLAQNSGIAQCDIHLLYYYSTVVVGYSQLVVSHISELETLFSCVNKLGTDSSHPAKSCREIYNYNMASHGQSGLTIPQLTTWS